MADGPDLTLLAALVAAQDGAREYLGGQATNVTAQAVNDYAAWYAMDSVAQWATQLAENVGAVLSVLAGITDAYMSTLIGELTGKGVRPATPIGIETLRTGVTPAETYQRVAAAYRYQQSRLDGAATSLATTDTPRIPRLALAKTIAANRAQAITDSSVQLVVQQQSARTMRAAADKGLVVGWRRMVHPELSRTGTCGLCIAASTRFYRTDHLMPIHTNCNCLPMPITDAHDPGLQLDRDAFARLYGEAGSTAAADLKKTRYVIHDNGELGPVLAPEGARQRTPRRVQADTSNAAPTPKRVKHRALNNLHDSLQRSLARVDELAASDPSGRWAEYGHTISDRIAQLDSTT